MTSSALKDSSEPEGTEIDDVACKLKYFEKPHRGGRILVD